MVVVSLLGAALCSHDLPVLNEVCEARWTGYGALICLLVSQSCSPLARFGMIASGTRSKARRQFGIAAALLATLHFIVVWKGFLQVEPWSAVEESPWLQAGSGALLLLLLLWLTSYPRLLRVLGIRNWQALHRFAYVATFFALVHAAMSPWVVMSYAFGLWALWLVLLIARIKLT